MFTEDSALVKLWVWYIKSGRYTFEQVPDISNLRDIVTAVLAQED